LFEQKAKEIYFKEWDTQRHSLPDSRFIPLLISGLSNSVIFIYEVDWFIYFISFSPQ